MDGRGRGLGERGAISNNVECFLVRLFLESGTYRASYTDPELCRLSDEMVAIERAHGLTEDESFHTDDCPEEWLALSKEWEARADAIEAEDARRMARTEIAELYESDRGEFEDRDRRGVIEVRGGGRATEVD